MNYGKFFDQIAGENINLTDKLTLYFNGVSSNKNTSVLHWQNTFSNRHKKNRGYFCKLCK